MVGADGAHSSVRHLLNLPFEGISYPEHFMLADIDLEWDLSREQLHIFLSKRGFLMALPLPGENRVRLFVDIPHEQSHFFPTRESFAQIIQERTSPDTPFALNNAGWMSRFRLHRRIVPRYQVGRIFLAGDAAHIHSPVGGMGMNMGVQDSFNLGWKLAMVEQKIAGPSLLESYHVERHAVGSSTLLKTDLATRMSMIRSAILQELRDQFSPLVMQVPGMKPWMAQITSALDVHVRNSPIVRAHRRSVLLAEVTSDPATEHASVKDWFEFGWGPEAGDRAPDRLFGHAGQKRRFSSLMNGKTHQLLLFDGAVDTPEGYKTLQRIAQRARQQLGHPIEVRLIIPASTPPPFLADNPLVLLDPGGDLHCSFGARAECLYLLRPDGYIAYRSQPAVEQALYRYLDAIF